MSWRRSAAAQALKRRQHAAPARFVLDLVEHAYQVAHRLLGDRDRPAIAGGWPARLVPFPAPRPFTAAERRELRRALASQNSSTFDGDAVRRFEHELARTFAVRHAISVSSGTAALHATVAAAGIGPGDEVVVPVLTHPSTAIAVRLVGADVRFVDADPASWNLDPRALEAAITPRTRAVIAVHLAGVPCDMRAIRAIAARARILVIEDAAQAHGSRLDGRWAGTLADAGCFSFQSSKTLTTGEGGAVLTDDDAFARRVRMAANLGETAAGDAPSTALVDPAPSTDWTYESTGTNYRLGALAAALGLGQLGRFEAIRAARARNAEQARRVLTAFPGTSFQVAPPGAEVCAPAIFARLDARAGAPERDALARALAAERVDHRLPYRRILSEHPIFAARGEFPVASALRAETIGFRVDPAVGAGEMRALELALRRLWPWSADGGRPRT